MNIQITNIPNGQKIKSIDFKIEFDDSSFVTNSVVTPAPMPSPTPSIVQAAPCSVESTESTEVPKILEMPDIDISNRPSKIPDEMLEESF